MMIELIYASAASQTFSTEDLTQLLAVARKKNHASDVTGLLLYQNKAFLQVLEGEPENVESVYRRINKDPRHHGMLLLHRGAITERRFGSWTMGSTSSSSH